MKRKIPPNKAVQAFTTNLIQVMPVFSSALMICHIRQKKCLDEPWGGLDALQFQSKSRNSALP